LYTLVWREGEEFMHRISFRWAVAFLTGVMLLTACNFPMLNPAQPNPGMIYTAAAETALANATLLAQPHPTITFLFTPQPTQTPSPPGLASLTPAPANTQSNTPFPASGSPTTEGSTTCNRAKFVRDITIPDGTQLSPEQEFTKTWRLQNTGTCPWTSGYSIVFTKGDRMEAPAEVQISDATVAPGEEVDVSVDLVAPADTGSFQGDWQLRSASGQTFGLGDAGDKIFWVRVEVVVPGGLAYDFLARASSADWISDNGSGSTALPFDGSPDDPLGFAGIQEGVTQEDERSSAKILVTYPPQVDGGSVEGTYSPYTVGAGDRLKGRLGFLLNSEGNCGPGQVVFRIRYQDGSSIRLLGEWRKSCDGKLLPIDVDLGELRGRTVSFILIVDSAGSFGGDRAFWSSLRIER
jgi:hypothetical protein